MSAEIPVPPFPESVEEGTLTTWHKQPGEQVARDEKVADIETDKIVLEVSAPSAGVLTDVRCKEGDSVRPGQVLAVIDADATPSGKPAASKADEKGKEAQAFSTEADPETDPKNQQPEEEQTEATDSGGSAKLSPAVRRLVEEHGIDPAALHGTGRDGRVTKADVLSYLEQQEAGTDADQTHADGAAEPGPKSLPVAPMDEELTASRPEKRVAMTRIRARIAERLVEAQQTAAILTTFNEVNMKPVMDLRAQYKKEFEATHGVKLGFMSFFVKAVVNALKAYPVVNATLDGKDIIYHGYYDVGVAVSTDRGLVVPILRNADQLSYAQIEQKIVEFASRAREGKLTMEDLTGGTFSITNGGVFGSLLSTPILNPPQSAILGMHKIEEKPVAENGAVVIRPMMYLALSYDHRLIDGREAVQFLVQVKRDLEHPGRALLGI